MTGQQPDNIDPATNNPEKIEMGRPNPVCLEVFRTIQDLRIPLNPKLSENFQKEEDPFSMRYGGPFALVSGNMIAGPTKYGLSVNTLERLFGEGSQAEELLYQKRLELERAHRGEDYFHIQKRIKPLEEGICAQTLDNIGASGLLTAEPAFKHKSAAILWELFRNAVSPNSRPDIPYVFKYTGSEEKVANCKDSEIYHAWTLSSWAVESGARAHIYYDEKTGEPILYQKTGIYKLDSGGINSTCINFKPIVVNGITILPGTLSGITTDLPEGYYKGLRNHAYPLSHVIGLTPVRLTMFGVPQVEQPITFGFHYEDFVKNMGFGPPKLSIFEDKAKLIMESV